MELSLDDDEKAEDAKMTQDTTVPDDSSKDVDPSLLTKILTSISGSGGDNPVPGFKMKNHLSLDDGGATPRNSMSIDMKDIESQVSQEEVETRDKPQRQASKFELSHRYSKF